MPANTLITDTMTAIFEDLDGVIRDISPTEVPIYSNGMKGTADNAAAHEWLTDTLRAPRNTPQNEGADTTFQALSQPLRLVNVCQIADDSGSVSGTASAVDAAPSSQREVVRQTIKKGREVRRDIETIIACNSVRSNTDPRNMSGLVTYMTNISIGATGTAPTGDGSDALAEGTPRAFTIALVDEAMQNAYDAGGDPTMLVLDTQLKTKFSKL
ncbi:MAG: SU10 major capsid protein, partial [Geminicoccaceae bacterium]